MMDLVQRAPKQRWVVDPTDDDTGTTSAEGQMQYLGEVPNTTASGRGPTCSPFLAGRVEQFLVDLE